MQKKMLIFEKLKKQFQTKFATLVKIFIVFF